MTKITPNWFISTWQTLNRNINIIRPTLVHYTNLCCGDHMIYVLVQFLWQHQLVHFLRERLWHIITCHQYIHTLRYPYHIPKKTLSNKLPSINIVWPIVASKYHTYRKFYAMQQPKQTGTICTNLPWLRPKFIVFFFMLLILIIGVQLL